MSDRDAGIDPDGDDGSDAEAAPAVGPALRAGVALFNEGFHLAAHEPWEAAWLPLEEGDDERLLHGVIQFAAATHHARTGNDSGAVGTAEGALGDLDGLGARHRGIALDPIREWCRSIAADPAAAADAVPPTLRIGDEPLGFDDLGLAATLAAIPAVAEATGIGDEETMEMAGVFTREERGTGRSRFAELAVAYLREPDARPQIAARIADHVDRKRRRRDDVDGLF